MPTLQLKLKIFFLPYFIVTTSFIAVYTLIHWVFIIQLHLFTPPELLVTTGLPLVLAWIPALIWVAPGINILNLYSSGRIVLGLYFPIAAFAPCLPTYFAQRYLIVLTGKLTTLQTLDKIDYASVTKYYKVNNCFVDKKEALSYQTSYLSGKRDETRVLQIYWVAPIFNKAIDQDALADGVTVGGRGVEKLKDTDKNTLFWLGVKYERRTSTDNGDSDGDFFQYVKERFADSDLQKFDYLERVDKSGPYYAYLHAIHTSPQVRNNRTMIFAARSGSFESRTVYMLLWVFLSYIAILAVWLMMSLTPDVDELGLARFIETSKL